MRNLLKSYHVFLSSRLLQILLYVLYIPFMMFWTLGFAGASTDFGFGIGMGYILTANLLFSGEIFWGYLIFGGVAAKDTNKLEYLKTSMKGMPTLKTAMMVDAVRRILWVTAIQWVPLFLLREQPDESILLTDVMIVLLANSMVLLFAELGCLFVRNSSSLTVFMLVAVGGTTLLWPLLSVTMEIASSLWPSILCYILAVVVMVLSIKMVMKKARDSFYDDRNQKMSEAV